MKALTMGVGGAGWDGFVTGFRENRSKNEEIKEMNR